MCHWHGPTNGLTQIVAAKQPPPPPHPTILLLQQQLHPPLLLHRFTSQQSAAKEAHLYTAATQLKPPAKRAASRCLVQS